MVVISLPSAAPGFFGDDQDDYDGSFVPPELSLPFRVNDPMAPPYASQGSPAFLYSDNNYPPFNTRQFGATSERGREWTQFSQRLESTAQQKQTGTNQSANPPSEKKEQSPNTRTEWKPVKTESTLMERRASDFVEGRYRYRIVTDHVLDGSASDKENNAPCLARTEIFIDQLQRMKECGSSQGFAWLDNISRCWSNDVKVVQHPVRPNGAIFVREIVIGCWCSVGPSVIRENIVQWDVRVSLYHPEAQKLLDMKLDEVKEYISKESLTRIVGHMFSTDDPLEVAKVFYVAQKPSPVQFIPKSYPEIWWNGDYDVKLQVNNADLREAVEECAIRFILQS